MLKNWEKSFDRTAEFTSVNLGDDQLLTFGDGGDGVILNRSTLLGANTALIDVLIGTPVTPALAANSLIISNTTADGDILMAGNDGGTSKAFLFFDASAPNLLLYNVGGTWTGGATTWRIPAVTLGGAVLVGTNSIQGGLVSSDWSLRGSTATAGSGIRLALRGNDSANSLVLFTPNTAKDADVLRLIISGNATTALASWSNITHTGIVLSGALELHDTLGINTGVSDNDYFTLGADDIGAGIVEVARAQGAAEPWFGIGKDSDVVKATYDDKLGFFSTTPISKPTLSADDVANVITVLVNLGLINAAV